MPMAKFTFQRLSMSFKMSMRSTRRLGDALLDEQIFDSPISSPKQTDH